MAFKYWISKLFLLYASFFHILSSTPTPTTLISNASSIIIIADIHGDIFRFKNILRDANILDINDRWIAEPRTIVIQLGDQIDPKPQDANDIDDKHHFKMIYFTNSLQKIAATNDCQFISLIGNHELYNIDKIKHKPYLRDIIAHRHVLLYSSKYIFCHGGFKKEHYGLLDMYNKTLDDINNIWSKYVYNIPMTFVEDIILRYLILDIENSILFTRTPDIDAEKLFHILDIDYMFVGHSTVQSITLKNKVWFLDMYLKDAFDNQVYNYLTISNDTIHIKSLEIYSEYSMFGILISSDW